MTCFRQLKWLTRRFFPGSCGQCEYKALNSIVYTKLQKIGYSPYDFELFKVKLVFVYPALKHLERFEMFSV